LESTNTGKRHGIDTHHLHLLGLTNGILYCVLLLHDYLTIVLLNLNIILILKKRLKNGLKKKPPYLSWEAFCYIYFNLKIKL